MTFNGHTIYTSTQGDWKVYAITSNDMLANVDSTKYANEASANLAALAMHAAKPFMNYVARRG